MSEGDRDTRLYFRIMSWGGGRRGGGEGEEQGGEGRVMKSRGELRNAL